MWRIDEMPWNGTIVVVAHVNQPLLWAYCRTVPSASTSAGAPALHSSPRLNRDLHPTPVSRSYLRRFRSTLDCAFLLVEPAAVFPIDCGVPGVGSPAPIVSLAPTDEQSWTFCGERSISADRNIQIFGNPCEEVLTAKTKKRKKYEC